MDNENRVERVPAKLFEEFIPGPGHPLAVVPQEQVGIWMSAHQLTGVGVEEHSQDCRRVSGPQEGKHGESEDDIAEAILKVKHHIDELRDGSPA